MRLKALFFTLSVLCFSIGYSQISFTNMSDLLENNTLSGGFSMGISDMNNDGLEDIIRFEGASVAQIEYQNADGTYSTTDLGALINGNVWSVAVADIDNNGFNDLMTGGFYESLAHVRTMGDKVHESVLLDGPLIFLQGMAFSDMDDDGFLDLFACHDDAVSSPYRGDGAGTLLFDDTLIDARSTVPSNNGGNYACIFTDYDNDGDNDLYLSKCRLGVTDPMHGERLNMMFRKEADGTWTEVAPLIGLQPQGQSWATEFGDIDNDGDLDAVMLNHDINSMVFENDGAGNFTDISASAGIDLNSGNFPTGMQTYMQDFDNDGFLDLFVTSYNAFPILFHNNRDKTFTPIVNPWGTDINTTTNSNIQSAAMGDLNNDGFVDMIVGFANGINIPNAGQPDRVYYNDGNQNNWTCIELIGTESNRNGIGARLEINGAWGTQIREVKAGQGYGIMNSMKVNVGIGNATEITSIVVRWPSGLVTTTFNPQINTCLTIEESTQATGFATVNICEGECHQAGGDCQTTSGTYTDEINADSILVTTLIVDPSFDIQANPVNTCFGTTIIFGEETIDAPGSYVFEYTTAASCDSIVRVDVNWFDEILVAETVTDDDGSGNGSISIDITGATEPVTISWSNEAVNVTEITGLEAGDYTVEIIDANLCTMSETFTVDLVSSLDDLIAEGINVYPNPFTDRILIKDTHGIVSKMVLYNNLGQQVITTNMSSNGLNLDTGSLTNGVYILQLLDAENRTIGSTPLVK
jgi:hypothetical protein